MKRKHTHTHSWKALGLRLAVLMALLAAISQPTAHSARLTGNFATPGRKFGNAVAISGTTALAQGIFNNSSNFTYFFRNLHTATGSVTETAYYSNGQFVYSSYYYPDLSSVAISGSIALVGNEQLVGITEVETVNLFNSVTTVSGNISANATIYDNKYAINTGFGKALSVSGTTGLVGAMFASVSGINQRGIVMTYRNLNSKVGNVTGADVYLNPSDGAVDDYFGSSVSIAGTIGLVGAPGKDIGSNTDQGKAYVFRTLDTATGNITQNASLTASDGSFGSSFGSSVSISGTLGLVGARGDTIGSNSEQGSAYVFRNLHTITGNITENAKLIASDGEFGDNFGNSVSLSGFFGLVGAPGCDINGNSDQGAAYIFRNLNTANGVVTQSVKLFASAALANPNDAFGCSVSLDSGRFIIGANGSDSAKGAAYTGHVRTFLAANLNNDATQTDGLSFISWENWIVGQSNSNATVTLSSGDTGDVTQPGTGVIVGQNNSSGNNTLAIALNALLNSNNVTVGNGNNLNNRLALNGQINLTAGSSVVVNQNSLLTGNGTIFGGNGLSINGSLRPGNNGLGRLNVTSSSVTWNGLGDPWVFELGNASASLMAAFSSNTTQDWLRINGGNFNKGTGSTFTFDFAGTGQLGWYKLVDWTGSTTFAAADFTGTNLASGLSVGGFTIDNSTKALYVQIIPEPATWLLLAAGLTTLVITRRRRPPTS